MKNIYYLPLLFVTPPLMAASVNENDPLPSTGTAISIEQREATLDGVQQAKKTIKGVVKDEAGEPVIGANIVEKGTTNGVITDIDGNFTLDVANNAVLQVSYIGYLSQEVVARGSSITIVLKEDTQALDEVVVVGYGTQKKSDLTGAVASVSAKDFIDQGGSAANNILIGKVPGLTVQSGSGVPGAATKIRVRGANSINGSNDPLYVVDGNYAGGLPPIYEIESVEVLKDASATAIYGSRGANGVILVTTKRGVEGKPTLKANVDLSVASRPKKYDLLDAEGFSAFNQAQGTYPFTDQQVASFRGVKGTDWQDETFSSALTQNYQVSISGGTKNVRYFVSPRYRKQDGVVLNTKGESYGLNARIDTDLSDRVTVQTELSMGHSNSLNTYIATDDAKTSNVMLASLRWSPTEPVYNEDGSFKTLGVGTGVLLSPVAAALGREAIDKSNSAKAVGNLRWKIIDGLELNAKASYSMGNTNYYNFETALYNGTNPFARRSSGESKEWLVNAFLTYTKTFADKHNLSAMAGFEETQYEYNGLQGDAKILPTESSKWYNLGLAAPSISVGSSYSNNALRSYFGRVNYNYASRYYVTANFRADGSSKFRPGNQFGYFPSFSLAWRLTEEEFMKDQDAFQNIKIRGGWGQTGSQAVGAYETYATLRGRDFTWGTNSLYVGYQGRTGGNPDLKWETTNQLDLGFDLTFMNSKMTVSVDYYNKKTVDLLAPRNVPNYNGGGSILSNIGSVRNEGVELHVSYDAVNTKEFSYSVDLNGAYNRNEVLDLGENEIIMGETYGSTSALRPAALIVGAPIGAIYGLQYLGIWQENEAAEAAKYGQNPGDYKYLDVNHDYTFTDEDRMVIGNTNPKFNWGLNNHFTYKNWGLNILVEGVHGFNVMNYTYMCMNDRFDFAQTYTAKSAMDRWSTSNPNAEFCKTSNTSGLKPNSTHYMQKGDYVKLRNISLTYQLPRTFCKFADISLSASAQNLLTITGYKGLDPESGISGNSDKDSGVDFFATPNPKTFSFGLTFTY